MNLGKWSEEDEEKGKVKGTAVSIYPLQPEAL